MDLCVAEAAKDDTMKLVYQCPKCPRQFNRIGFFKCHFYRVHPEFRLTSFVPDPPNAKIPKTLPEVKEEPPEPKKLFKCNVCGKRFLKGHPLAVHKARAHPDKVATKTEDDVPMDSDDILLPSDEESIDEPTIAIKAKEEVQQPAANVSNTEFACKMCNKSFTDKKGLNSHLMLHAKNKLFNCSICSKIFTKPIQLQAHMQIHKKEKSFSCKVCNSEFTSKAFLDKHFKSKHSNPCECKTCGKTFLDTNSYNNHLETHKDETSYVCTQCDEKFSRQCLLSRHINTVHKVTIKKEK